MKKLLLCVLVLACAAVSLLIPSLLTRRKFNIALITVDTLRADYLSCYNKTAAVTSEMDMLARNGVLFQQAYSLIPRTLPAHASILTSRPPHELKIFDNGQAYQENFPILSEVLKSHGYSTAAFVSLAVLEKKFGLDRGFQTYNDDLKKQWHRTASQVNKDVFPWLEGHRDKPFFAWIHYSDPHAPYLPEGSPPDIEFLVDGLAREKFLLANGNRHSVSLRLRSGATTLEFRTLKKDKTRAGFFRRAYYAPASSGIEIVFGPEWHKERLETGRIGRFFDSAGKLDLINNNSEDVEVKFLFSGGVTQSVSDSLRNYAVEVRQIDKAIGALRDKLEQLGIANKTILVLTADHGEGLNSHGHISHAHALYNELLKVPLLIYHPFFGRKGNTVDQIVDHLDIMPTILDLAHVDVPFQMRGQSLGKYVTWELSDRFLHRNKRRPLSFASTPSLSGRTFAVQNGKFKMIKTFGQKKKQYSAYDLSVDPMERNNLLKTNPKAIRQHPFLEWKELLVHYARMSESARMNRPKKELDAEDLEMLEALGYIGKE